MFYLFLFLNTLSFILIPSTFSAGINSCSVDDDNSKENQKLRLMLLAVTLDGHLTALDAHNNIMWTKIHRQPLLSTSQLSLLYTKNGATVRAIPSLTRGLFECKGNFLAELPIDHNQNQWKLSNSTTLRNTMQTNLCVIQLCTGRELFCAKCIERNCNALLNSYVLNFTSTINKKFIVEKRITETVRLEEDNSDVKKNPWSYTVTDVQLRLRNQILNPFQALSERSQKCDK